MQTPRRAVTPATAYARRAVTLCVGVLIATTVAACGQPTPSGPDDGSTVSVAIQPTLAPETPTQEEASTPSAAVTDDLFDASSSLTDGRCAPTGESWSFTGTLRNTDSVEHTFSVGVSVVQVSTSDILATKEVEVKVAAGATAPVEVEDVWAGGPTGVECLSGVTVKDL